MLKACIEIISTGESTWMPIPNGDLGTAISDFTGDKDWECNIITGIVKDNITQFTNNSFHKCNLYDFNQMLLQAHDFQYTNENLAVLNLLLEHYNYDVDYVVSVYEDSGFKVYYGAEDMGDVAAEYIENNFTWLEDAENQVNFACYFDFKSYGEEVLASSGTYLQDKNNKVIVEVY